MSGGGAPADYAEMFDRYYAVVCHWVRKAHIVEQDVDDVAMDLIAKFIEKQGLENYDPTRARFITSFSAFMRTYVLSYRDKQMDRHRREILTEHVREADGCYEVPFTVQAEFEGWVQEVEAYLRVVPGRKDLVVVFQALAEAVRREEALDPSHRSALIRTTLGSGRGTAWRATRDLKAALVAGGFV